jgi:2'-5' RNA ligase
LTALRTALAVVVDEAEPVVEDFRRRFDPAVERRIPAHVTIVVPFAPLAVLDEGAVRALYAALPSFAFELARVERFPEHVWLAPEPRDRFVDLISRTVERFPEYRPYGGTFADVVPHLTIASGETVDEAEAAARRELGPHLPIPARAAEVTLLEEHPDATWAPRTAFAFGGA